jgi:hypothetical protein
MEKKKVKIVKKPITGPIIKYYSSAHPKEVEEGFSVAFNNGSLIEEIIDTEDESVVTEEKEPNENLISRTYISFTDPETADEIFSKFKRTRKRMPPKLCSLTQ